MGGLFVLVDNFLSLSLLRACFSLVLRGHKREGERTLDVSKRSVMLPSPLIAFCQLK